MSAAALTKNTQQITAADLTLAGTPLDQSVALELTTLARLATQLVELKLQITLPLRQADDFTELRASKIAELVSELPKLPFAKMAGEDKIEKFSSGLRTFLLNQFAADSPQSIQALRSTLESTTTYHPEHKVTLLSSTVADSLLDGVIKNGLPEMPPPEAAELLKPFLQTLIETYQSLISTEASFNHLNTISRLFDSRLIMEAFRSKQDINASTIESLAKKAFKNRKTLAGIFESSEVVNNLKTKAYGQIFKAGFDSMAELTDKIEVIQVFTQAYGGNAKVIAAYLQYIQKLGGFIADLNLKLQNSYHNEFLELCFPKK